MNNKLVCLLSTALAILSTSGAVAQVAEPQPVDTLARVTSFLDAPEGKYYVRLKLLPRTPLPFMTQTLRVTDRALLDGVQEGTWVRFLARPVNGEVTVTALRTVAQCKRFETCH